MSDTAWHPIAASDDLTPRHVFHGQLLGRELAVWRADDGFVNVWENRCLHRGVRLSIGTNTGSELVCRYHGWRYANRTAGCTYIPAHPANSPARTIANRAFPVAEKYGLVWSGSDGGAPPEVAVLDDGEPFVLRGLPVNAPAALVCGLLDEYRPSPSESTARAETLVHPAGASESTVVLRCGDDTVVFFVQPVDAQRSVVRSVLSHTPPADQHLTVWQRHARALSVIVERAESAAGEAAETAELTADEPVFAAIEIPVLLPPAAGESPSERAGVPLRVRVARKYTTATDVAGFDFEPLDREPLPTFQPGAHIDVQLANGLTRQYSLINGPGETGAYRIGVKRDPNSSGGSAFLHDTVHEGDVLAISAPHNSFVLRRDVEHTLLIAGGIGVTPLLAMAQALSAMRLDFTLHYFAQSQDHLAFEHVRSQLGEHVVTHLGLDPAATEAELATLCAAPATSQQLYVCGPPPMIKATRRVAAAAGWPDASVHFEYFANPNDIDDSSAFEVHLARSALTLPVAAGESILQVLQANGVALPSSCEQGACGTCEVGVLEGEVRHQDVYLSDSERASGDRMMTCVSRALTTRLVLDI